MDGQSKEPEYNSSNENFNDYELQNVLLRCWNMSVIAEFKLWATKTCHFVFVYDSGVPWSIFVLFEPLETGMKIEYSIAELTKFTTSRCLHTTS